MTDPDPHDPPPGGEIVGVILGAVALFIAISILPIAVTWHRRRRLAAAAAAAAGASPTNPDSEASRRDSALQTLTGSPSMQQVPTSTTVAVPVPINVERWLEEQTHSGTNEPWHFAQESCAICLERLKVDEKATTDTSNLPLADPKPAWIDPRCSNRGPLANSDLEMGLGDWRRGSLPVSLSSSSDMNDAQQTKQPGGDDVLVLNRCNHVFHASCLVLWVEQHRYRCPICQASLKHGS